ncbi:DnaB-like helicase C-terminal domain-containing protein [bacterium]|nr:DnaB-like helicase C-terminal domain-containing protein [candidate division CSSED10-310 bacterium]
METPIASAGNITNAVINSVSKRKKGTISGLPTGFSELDRILSGLNKGNMITVAGHPGIGTTAFALRLAEHLSIDNNIPALFFSMELEKEKLIERMLMGRAKVNLRKANEGDLEANDWDIIQNTASVFIKKPMFIDDTNRLTFSELKENTKEFKTSHNIQCIIVDYLQAMRAEKSIDLSSTDYADIAGGLKWMALELNIPILLLVHLSFDLIRADEEGCQPRVADFGETIIVERYADVVMLLHRENYYGYCAPDSNSAEIYITKNRNGPTGMVKLSFHDQYARFENLI